MGSKLFYYHTSVSRFSFFSPPSLCFVFVLLAPQNPPNHDEKNQNYTHTTHKKTKNSLLIIRAIQSHCSLTREYYDCVQVRGQKKKEKRPVTVALPYPPLLHQNEGKLNKKNRNRKRFSCFFNNTTKKG